MAALLLNFRNTMILSLVLALIMIVGFGMHNPHGFDRVFVEAVFRWMHVGFGILWIGLLYYFNFVQIRKMPEIPAELKPAVSKYIAPEALFWFRWAALFTVLAGLCVAVMRGYLWKVLSLGFVGTEPGAHAQYALLGVGIWLAIIMFLLGSGPVKGFAWTLSIGVMTSVFTAFLVTQVLIGWWFRAVRPKTLPI